MRTSNLSRIPDNNSIMQVACATKIILFKRTWLEWVPTITDIFKDVVICRSFAWKVELPNDAAIFSIFRRSKFRFYQIEYWQIHYELLKKRLSWVHQVKHMLPLLPIRGFNWAQDSEIGAIDWFRSIYNCNMPRYLLLIFGYHSAMTCGDR